MSHDIITGQYVRIEQTPASIGTRLLALLIDDTLIAVVLVGLSTLDRMLKLTGAAETAVILLALAFLAFYSLLCEVLNNGQSVGKRLMHLRVTRVDGSEPTIGSYLLRWLLYPVDVGSGGAIGLISALATKNHQRLGDLAAGTVVIKEQDYHHLHVSLDEFAYVSEDYRPTYVQAADLSLEQVNVITRTLDTRGKDRDDRILQLSRKIIGTLRLPADTRPGEPLLQTLLRDYQYYALEEL